MKTEEKNDYVQQRLEELRHALRGVKAPFVCDGSFLPKRPVTLEFQDKTKIPVLPAKNAYEQTQQLESLVRRCKPAPFGEGRKTRYDRSVRDALQLKADDSGFKVLNFDPAAAGILEQVRRELTPHVSDPPIAELYCLNVYQDGGHFAPHKDTPQTDDTIGSLVVCLPSHFRNGVFVAKHHGMFKSFDWGDQIEHQTEPARVHWAAFFGDVDHQIERVWSGLRVTLSYNLRRPAQSQASDEPAPVKPKEATERALRSLLDDRRFLPRGGTLAFPCSHLYHQDLRFQRKQRPISRQTASSLKGRDAVLAAVVLAEGLETTLWPYLLENCADETWRLEHFPTPREEAALRNRMDPWKLEKALSIQESVENSDDFDVLWVEPPPHFNGAPTMYSDEGDGGAKATDPELPAIAFLHGCEYSATGYFGNEGGDVNFYVYGALHVVIPPFGKGTRATVRKRPSPRKGSTKKTKISSQ